MSEEALASDADNAELMQQIERTIPPMNIADAGRLLDEAKQIFRAIASSPSNPRSSKTLSDPLVISTITISSFAG